MPIEDLFFKFFGTEYDYPFTKRIVVNQGEILETLNRETFTKATKRDVKDICVKNKMEQGSHRFENGIKTGYVLFIKDENHVPDAEF